ncbi:hypothetical protein ACXR0O_14000 [Verrucomicrobiota bacterium sgz303538]
MDKFEQDRHFESAGLPSFESALEGWLDAMTAYHEGSGGDYAWHYRERTCIGFLAAGVWRSGGVALEEWHARKRLAEQSPEVAVPLTENPIRKHCRGRCDLWAHHKDRYDYHIEAKYLRSDATTDQTEVGIKIENALERAADDARRLTCAPRLKLGVLFVVPFFSPGKQRNIRDQTTAWLRQVCSVPHAAVAWLFRDCQTIRARRSPIGPGIVLLARKAHPKTIPK